MVRHAGFYLLRCPYLPVSEIEKYTADHFSFKEFQQNLQSFFLQPDIEEAIYLASPELYDQLMKWINGEITSQKSINKLTFSLYKYLLRMCTRPTPYGIFAGIATGRITDACRIQLDDNNSHARKRRLDMSLMVELCGILSNHPEVRESIRFFPNSTIYKMGDRFRYVEYATNKVSRKFSLVSVDSSDYLEQARSIAKYGATIQELAAAITDEEIEETEAREFVEDLIENQILISELEPQVTGQRFLEVITGKLKSIPPSKKYYDQLVRIDEMINNDQFKLSNYKEIDRLLNQLGIQSNNDEIVQTDLHLNMQANVLPDKVVNELKDQVLDLWALAGKYLNPELDEFKKEFLKRYDSQILPLAQVLDPEFGIGYSSIGKEDAFTPLVGNRVFSAQDTWNEDRMIRWSMLADWKLRMYTDAVANGSYEVSIPEEELKAFAGKRAVIMPESFYLRGSLLGNNNIEIENGSYQFLLEGCGGPSGVTLLARFSQNDTELATALKAFLDVEQQELDDAIYAEIVHLPQPRVGNVLTRSILREYELVYLANSAVAVDHQINLDDLLVTVRNDEVILYSKTLRKRILPRLTTAHNFHNGDLAIYKFWGDLQYQNINNVVDWKWGIMDAYPFLPRVVYKNIILHRATWLLEAAALEMPDAYRKDAALLIDNAAAILQPVREKIKLPRYVVVTEGDNELFIDLDNKFNCYLLIETLLKKEKITIREYLNTAENCFVDGMAGRHSNQVIIPFKNHRTNAFANAIPDLTAPTLKRTFSTGSEWLYLKIYAGVNTIEDILRDELRTLLMNTSGIWEKWFFVRYADPDRHLRIRFYNHQDKGFWVKMLQQIHHILGPLEQTGIIWKIQTDTYQREIERYSEELMEPSEQLFSIDSTIVPEFLTLIEDAQDETFRWLFVLKGIDAFLDDFGYNTEEKIHILDIMYTGFFKEFGSGKDLSETLNERYRFYKKDIERTFVAPVTNKEIMANSLLSHRSMQTKPVAQAILHHIHTKYGPDKMRLHGFLINHIHMFCNKIFSSRPRLQELFVYNFLYRYHNSMKARARIN